MEVFMNDINEWDLLKVLFIGVVLGMFTTAFIATHYCQKKGFNYWSAEGCYNRILIYDPKTNK